MVKNVNNPAGSPGWQPTTAAIDGSLALAAALGVSRSARGGYAQRVGMPLAHLRRWHAVADGTDRLFLPALPWALRGFRFGWPALRPGRTRAATGQAVNWRMRDDASHVLDVRLSSARLTGEPVGALFADPHTSAVEKAGRTRNSQVWAGHPATGISSRTQRMVAPFSPAGFGGWSVWPKDVRPANTIWMLPSALAPNAGSGHRTGPSAVPPRRFVEDRVSRPMAEHADPDRTGQEQAGFRQTTLASAAVLVSGPAFRRPGLLPGVKAVVRQVQVSRVRDVPRPLAMGAYGAGTRHSMQGSRLAASSSAAGTFIPSLEIGLPEQAGPRRSAAPLSDGWVEPVPLAADSATSLQGVTETGWVLKDLLNPRQRHRLLDWPIHRGASWRGHAIASPVLHLRPAAIASWSSASTPVASRPQARGFELPVALPRARTAVNFSVSSQHPALTSGKERPAATPLTAGGLIDLAGTLRGMVTREVAEQVGNAEKRLQSAVTASPAPSPPAVDVMNEQFVRRLLAKLQALSQEERFRSGRIR